jgi:hypothetical protein
MNKGSAADPHPDMKGYRTHQFGKSDPDPQPSEKLVQIRIRVQVKGQIWIRIKLKSQVGTLPQRQESSGGSQ